MVSKNARIPKAHTQDNPPPDVKPRYQWMSYWTPRALRGYKGGKSGGSKR